MCSQKKKQKIDSQKTDALIAYSPLGIHSLATVDPDLHVATIAQALLTTDKLLCHQDHVYLFGWSGGFTPEARASAGIHLYQELKKLTDIYIQRYATCPPLVLITHSHGGNVALECASLYDETVTIEKLILLACPVQEKTKPYTQSPLFKQIYSIHSDKDYFQILDMQGLHPVWNAFETAFKSSSLEPIKQAWRTHNRPTKILSERHFPYQPNLKQGCIEWHQDSHKWSLQDLCIMQPFLSEKNVQKLQKNLHTFDKKKRALMHIEFLFPSFLQQLPHIIETLDTTPMPTDTLSTVVINI